MQAKPKILLLVTLSEWGGAQHIVYLLAKHLREEYEITVACAPGGELISKLCQENIRVVEISALCRNLHPWHDLIVCVSEHDYLETRGRCAYNKRREAEYAECCDT